MIKVLTIHYANLQAEGYKLEECNDIYQDEKEIKADIPQEVQSRQNKNLTLRKPVDLI